MQAHDSLIELARARAIDAPDGRAYSFLPEGAGEETHLTHRELDERARAIAAGLQRHAAKGDRALLLLPPGRDFVIGFLGALYAGLTVAPMQPPATTRLDDALARLTGLAEDAEPAVVVGNGTTLDLIASQVARESALGRAVWRSIDELSGGGPAPWRDPGIGPEALAFLQYTSGSTGAPRGVMVRHGNVLANCAVIQQAFETDQRSQGVIWLPPYHDMGLIGGILHPLFVGFPVTLMTPTTFLLRPLKWLQAISRQRATVSGAPNFAFDWCVRKISPQKRAGLDLSCWRVAFVGAEPVRANTLARFTEAFAPCGFRQEAFYPCYGLAEATLMVSGGRVGEAPIVRSAASRRGDMNAENVTGQTIVGNGTPRPGQELAIVDSELCTRVAPGDEGEIWVRGPSVAAGYWRRADETGRTFMGRLADDSGGPWLRTGDLGRLDREGELFTVGRLKDVVIIGGRKHAAEDIELTVRSCQPDTAANGCVAFSIDNGVEERLIVAVEADRRRTTDFPALAKGIRQAVAERHDLRVDRVALLRSGLPRTASGKVRRQACRQAYLGGILECTEVS